jgi:hypothetical protein
MAETKQTLLNKVELKNAQTAVKNAAGDLTSGLPELPDVGALPELPEVPDAGGLLGAVESGLDSVSGAIQSGVSGLTANLPKGIQQIGQNLADQIDPKKILKGSVEDLKQIKSVYEDAVNRVSNVKSPSAAGGILKPNDTSNPDNAMTKKRGVIDTYVFPKDYSRELCFRLDFVQFNRKSVFESTKVQPKATFILPLPRAIGLSQGISYSQQELGTFGEVEARMRTGKGDAGGIVEDVVSGVASAMYRTFIQTDAGRAASQELGFIPNPHLSNIFAGVTMRGFDFEIQLAPRSEEESVQISNLIDNIRANSLPRRSGNFTTLDYPNECLISFSEAGSTMMTGGPGKYKTPLDNMFKFKRCVITGVNVNINSAGDQSFFTNYSPVEMTLSLSFQEQQIHTADMYGSSDKFGTTGNKYKELAGKIEDKIFDKDAGGR